MLAIEAKSVTKIYKGSSSPALKDFSLKAESGTIFTLLDGRKFLNTI
jgi:ABC-type multidrug transport system ATPase subunit